MPKVICLQSHFRVKCLSLSIWWHILKTSCHTFPMTSLLQTHSYTIVTKALHTFKMKQSYMILSNKVSCYDLPAAVSCRLKKILCSLSRFGFGFFCPAIHCIFTSPAIPQDTKAEPSFQGENTLLLISVAYVLVTSKWKSKRYPLFLHLFYDIQSHCRGPRGEPAEGDP